MGRWQDYYEDAATFAMPYVKRAGHAAQKVKKQIQKEQKRIIRRQKVAHIAHVVEVIANSVLLVAAGIALAGAVWKYLSGKQD